MTSFHEDSTKTRIKHKKIHLNSHKNRCRDIQRLKYAENKFAINWII